MLFDKPRRIKHYIIYNYDYKTQQMTLLFRGEQMPSVYREYPKLWRLLDKKRHLETVIISI